MIRRSRWRRSRWLELDRYSFMPAWSSSSRSLDCSWICDGTLQYYFDIPRRAKKIRVIISDRSLRDRGYKILHAGGVSLAFMTNEGVREHLVYGPLAEFCRGSKGEWIGIEYV